MSKDFWGHPQTNTNTWDRSWVKPTEGQSLTECATQKAHKCLRICFWVLWELSNSSCVYDLLFWEVRIKGDLNLVGLLRAYTKNIYTFGTQLNLLVYIQPISTRSIVQYNVMYMFKSYVQCGQTMSCRLNLGKSFHLIYRILS